MREIKFRGKRLDNGEWLYGNLVELRNPFNPNDAPACFIMPKEVNIAAPDSIAEQEVVDPDTVGQFTGLLDKNGREIYEGDVLLLPSNGKIDAYERGEELSQPNRLHFAVVWAKQCQGFGLCSPYEALFNAPDVAGMAAVDRMYIIGNIHDNPELMQ
ncbi:MAG: hypothetical protein IJN55_08065 [Alistipes sp.]|nr:hypothetical protein [Alistipes sp.]